MQSINDNPVHLRPIKHTFWRPSRARTDDSGPRAHGVKLSTRFFLAGMMSSRAGAASRLHQKRLRPTRGSLYHAPPNPTAHSVVAPAPGRAHGIFQKGLCSLHRRALHKHTDTRTSHTHGMVRYERANFPRSAQVQAHTHTHTHIIALNIGVVAQPPSHPHARCATAAVNLELGAGDNLTITLNHITSGDRASLVPEPHPSRPIPLPTPSPSPTGRDALP